MLPDDPLLTLHKIEDNTSIIGYVIKYGGYEISPHFTTIDPPRYDHYHDGYEDIESCECEAITWLKDFLIRLSKNPTVVHCVSDGEIFIYN